MSKLRRGRSRVRPADEEDDLALAPHASDAEHEHDEEPEAAAPASKGRKRKKGSSSSAASKKKRAKGRPSASDSVAAESDAGTAAAAAGGGAVAATTGPWSCATCTFSNGAATLACSMCSTPRPVSVPGKWQCSSCTASNLDSAEHCTTCDAAKDEEVCDLTGGHAADGSAAAAAGAAPKLQETPLFLAGLEESLGCVTDVSDYFKQRLTAAGGAGGGLKKQWHLLADKFKGDERFAPADVEAMQKTLVHRSVQRALRVRDTMQLLMDCGAHELKQLRASVCHHCSASGVEQELLYCSFSCTHALCVPCLRRFVLGRMEARSCLNLSCPSSSCDAELPNSVLRKALSRHEFNQYSDMCFELSTADPDKYQRCPDPRCAGLSEIVRLAPGQQLALPKGGITLTDESGKLLSEAAWRHYSEHRLRCPDCNTNFCASCRVTPYHLGKTCAEFKEYAASRHCRFCTEQLAPATTDTSVPNGLPVCTTKDCQAMRARCCTGTLACGHACFGVKDEEEHPPCLEEDCKEASDKGGDNCGICYVEELRHFGPVVQLSSCKHLFHEKCVSDKLEKKWSGTRITFGFRECSQCKVPMEHPSAPLQALLQPIQQLYDEVRAKAVARLAIEKMEQDAKLITPGSQFYGKAEAYALASFAYYNCFKCRKFYFGGRRDCEQNAAAEVRPEEEFVCYDCADLKATACKKDSHQEYQLYKCRFCCSPAVWFCFGTTHFCDPCHIRPGDVMGRRKDMTKQCAGPEHCPIKGHHAPNGPDADCEHNVGCGLCTEKITDKLAERKKEELVNAAIEEKAAAAAAAAGGAAAKRRTR